MSGSVPMTDDQLDDTVEVVMLVAFVVLIVWSLIVAFLL
jgi:hypothetical protein